MLFLEPGKTHRTIWELLLFFFSTRFEIFFTSPCFSLFHQKGEVAVKHCVTRIQNRNKVEEKKEKIPQYIPRILPIKENNHDLSAKQTPCYGLYYGTNKKSLLMEKKFVKAIGKIGKFGVTIAVLNCSKYPDACKNNGAKKKDLPILWSYQFIFNSSLFYLI
jgi:hypothetical protein